MHAHLKLIRPFYSIH